MAKKITQISDLTPDSQNANKGTERGQYMIETSLRKVGAGRSVVVDKDGRIIAGNKTVENWADIADSDDIEVIQTDGKKLVVVQRTDLDLASDDDTMARELAYYDNRAGEVSLAWDAEVLLADLAKEIPLNDFFREDELDELLAEIDQPVETPGEDTPPETTRADELLAKWNVKAGQLWRAGNHKIYCGDSIGINVESIFGEIPTNIIFDPPWDMDVETPKKPEWNNILAFSDGGHASHVIESLGAPSWIFIWDCVTSWWASWHRPLRRYKNCLWYGELKDFNLKGAFWGEPLEAKTVSNTRGTYDFVPDSRGKHLSDVFSHPITDLHSSGDGSHKHQKPLEWLRLLIGDCTSGDVYDPFAGSGTSIIACQQLGRRCYAVEIDPSSVAVILQRYEDAFGVTPIRETD